MEFWEELNYEVRKEEIRYEVYLDKIKSIDPKRRKKDFIEVSALLQNEKAYLDALKRRQQQLTSSLLGFAKIIGDRDGYIFVNGVLNHTLTDEEIAIHIGKSVAYVKRKKNDIQEDLDEYGIDPDVGEYNTGIDFRD